MTHWMSGSCQGLTRDSALQRRRKLWFSSGIRLGAVLALLTSLAACTHPVNSSTGSVSSSPAATINPPPVNTNSGSSQTHNGDGSNGIAISMPGMPIGPGNTHGNYDECAGVRWLGQSIPRGYTVTVTGVIVHSDNNNFNSSNQIPGDCAGYSACKGYRWTSDSPRRAECVVAIEYTGSNPDEDTGTLELTGKLSCPDAGLAACRQIGMSLQHQGAGSVGIDPPISAGSGSATPSGSDSSTPSGSGSSTPAGSGSSTPAGSGSP